MPFLGVVAESGCSVPLGTVTEYQVPTLQLLLAEHQSNNCAEHTLKCFPSMRSMRAPLLLLTLLSGVATGSVCRYAPDANGHVDVPYGETSIDDFAFYACDALVSITLPSSVTRIGDYAFVACPLLTWVTTSDRLTSIGHSAFYRCNSLAHVSLPDGSSRPATDPLRCTSWAPASAPPHRRLPPPRAGHPQAAPLRAGAAARAAGSPP